MKMVTFRVQASLALILIAASSDAGQRVLDLSTAPGSRVSLTAPVGEAVTFKVINRLPKKAYTLTLEQRVIPIPVLETPSRILGVQAEEDPCKPILALAETLETAADEAAVAFL